MKGKKIISLTMTVLMIVAMLTGCKEKPSGGDNQGENQTQEGLQETTGNQTKTNGNREMGRYIEKAIGLPEGGSSYVAAKVRADAPPEVYMSTESGDKTNYTGYNYVNGDWKAMPTAWLSGIEGSLSTIILGEDGYRYAVYNDDKYRSHIYRSKDLDEASEEVIIPYLTEPYNSYEGMDLYPNVTELLVMKDGTLAVRTMEREFYALYTPEGEEIAQLDTTNYMTGATLYGSACGNKIAYLNAAGDSIIIYNKETTAEEQKIPIPDGKDNSVILTEDDTLYRLNRKGIHKLAPGGTLWETLIDGDLNTMGMPSMYFTSFTLVSSEKDRFYVPYFESNTTALKEYYFDEEVPSVPSQKLTIYSLYDSNTIRQAIAQFQAKNTDVKVEYIVAMQDAEAGTAPDDYIRALNTELLSGKGADLLLLDGLPVESYVKKGVLADMSSVIKPMVDSGELLPNLFQAFFEGDAIYSAPVHFSTQLYIGDKNKLNDVSLNHLAALTREQTGGTPSFMKMTEEQWIRFFLYEQYDRLFKEDGTFSPEAYQKFLTDLSAIAGAYEKDEDNPEITYGMSFFGSQGSGYSNKMQGAFGTFYSDYRNKKSLFTAKEISEWMSFNMVDKLCKEDKDAGFISMDGHFYPNGLIGVNAASDKEELIAELLKVLFGEELQSYDLYEGFPVNAKALENSANRASGTIVSTIDQETGENITYDEAKKEDKLKFVEFCRTLIKPVRQQEAIMDMFIKEGKAYLTGEKGLEDAVSAVTSKVSLYEAE